MSKKYVILGAGGQLGKALCAMFPDAKALSREELDIADEEQVKAFDWSKYDVIINAAALVNAVLRRGWRMLMARVTSPKLRLRKIKPLSTIHQIMSGTVERKTIKTMKWLRLFWSMEKVRQLVIWWSV